MQIVNCLDISRVYSIQNIMIVGRGWEGVCEGKIKNEGTLLYSWNISHKKNIVPPTGFGSFTT